MPSVVQSPGHANFGELELLNFFGISQTIVNKYLANYTNLLIFGHTIKKKLNKDQWIFVVTDGFQMPSALPGLIVDTIARSVVHDESVAPLLILRLAKEDTGQSLDGHKGQSAQEDAQ